MIMLDTVTNAGKPLVITNNGQPELVSPDEIWLITRTNKTDLPVIWKPELAPPTELFYRYCSFKKSGIWNMNTFEQYYLPQFLLYIIHQVDALNELYTKAKKNTIQLLCYCTDETTCHRSIIGGIEQGVGIPVVSRSHPEHDYLRYYFQYLSIRNSYTS